MVAMLSQSSMRLGVRMMENKALWIFPNFYESISELPKTKQADVWKAVCEYGLGIEPDISHFSKLQKAVYRALVPLLKLRSTGGSIKPKEIRNVTGKNQFSSVSVCNSTKVEENPSDNPKEKGKDNSFNNNKKKISKKEINKEKSFGELGFVHLTDEQHSNLLAKLGQHKLSYGIEVLDTWLAKDSKTAVGYKNKNHYAFFKSNSWVWDNYKEPEVKTTSWWRE